MTLAPFAGGASYALSRSLITAKREVVTERENSVTIFRSSAAILR